MVRVNGMARESRPRSDDRTARVAAETRSPGLYLVVNHHSEAECAATIAAWRRFESALRRSVPISGCSRNDHRIWWRVDTRNQDEALAMLPSFVASRTV